MIIFSCLYYIREGDIGARVKVSAAAALD